MKVRTARPLAEEVLSRIETVVGEVLRRPVRLVVQEDRGLLAGLVVRYGNKIWDGSLAGRVSRAAEALSIRVEAPAE